jgi:hypothetical protein
MGPLQWGRFHECQVVSHVEVDHVVVAAATLEAGVAWCEKTLGVSPGPGGQHALFGTHNRLLNISTAAYERAYLEIIAIDPNAPPPARKRWFDLDNPALQERLLAGPRLVHFVARSTMLDMHRWGLITVGHKPGDPVNASRPSAQGLLAWQILVREDGGLDCHGALPTLIQWQGVHPTDAMPASGVSLRKLTLHGVPERARQVLRLRGVAVLPEPQPSALQVVLQTPLGEVTLRA